MPLEVKPQRRVGGNHDLRADGLADLLARASGASVMDLGCNRGLVGFEFYLNGARLVHGIELAPDAVQTARSWFADLHVQSQFEIGDLTQGAKCFEPFGEGGYDIMVMVGVYHKIKRPPSKSYVDLGAKGMSAEELSSFMTYIGHRTLRYLGARCSLEECVQLDEDFGKAGLRRVATSEISDIGPTGIWKRVG